MEGNERGFRNMKYDWSTFPSKANLMEQWRNEGITGEFLVVRWNVYRKYEYCDKVEEWVENHKAELKEKYDYWKEREPRTANRYKGILGITKSESNERRIE